MHYLLFAIISKKRPEMERSHLNPYYDHYADVALTQYYNVDFVAVQRA